MVEYFRRHLGAKIFFSYLVIIVLGSIVAGIATPTEAAGMGCAGAVILAVGYRKFSWKMLKDACWSTTLTTSMIMTLFLLRGSLLMGTAK